MISDTLVHLSSFITHTISLFGYLGVAILMAIESAAIPLPSEVIKPFAGFLAAGGQFSLIGLGLAGGIGSTIGSLVTYYIGYFGGRPLIAKYGHWIFLSERELYVTERFFQRFKHTATLFGRVLPVIRTFISIPAGIAQVPVITFAINAFIGSFIWSLFLAWLGLHLGQNWNHLSVYFHKFDLVVGIAVIAVIGYWIHGHFKPKASS
jgi:membrane protein DedA with SNARE-associated domain